MTKPAKTMTREERMVELAQAMLSNATIAKRMRVSARTVRDKLNRARKRGFEVPFNAERLAHEQSRSGIRLSPLSEHEIARLDRAAGKRGLTGPQLLDRIVRELLDKGQFPALIDNVLDDGVMS